MPLRLAELLFPPRCVACREILPSSVNSEKQDGNDALCEGCRSKFEAEKQKKCRRCQKALFECGCMPDLLKKSDCFAAMRVCGYNGNFLSPVTRIVFTLKRKANGSCEKFAAYQLSQRLKRYLDEYPDCDFCVTYIPRRKRAIINFGHDHGELLARKTAKICGLEFFKFIENKGNTKEQKSLDSAGRKKNARSAFSASGQIEDVKGKNVILIDDIMTSGASLAAGTAILMEGGAASVTCLCFASTEKKSK